LHEGAQEHRDQRRRHPVAGDVREVETETAFVDVKSVDEVAAQERRRHHVAGETVRTKAQMIAGQHPKLDFSARVLVLGQQPQAALEFLVEGLEIAAVASIFLEQPRAFERLVDGVGEGGPFDGLRDVVPGSELERADRVFHETRARNDDDRHVRELGARGRQELETVELRHAQVA
jgi:hypothetical protein